MHGNYFFLAVVVILTAVSPAAASLTKISPGAPVYVGEQNLDIAAGLQGCRALAWWANGSDTSAPPAKNVTIIKTLDDSEIAHHYSIDPVIYSGYPGPWYCEGKLPLRVVFEVIEPQLSVRFWDLDRDADVSGQTIPLTANITYRIDTNLDKALQLRYRPDVVSLDSFYTVSLRDPANEVLSSVYTGSYGRADFGSLTFEKNPIISATPFYWKDGSAWERTAKNKQGDFIYPPGTYTITVNQNLNHMQEMYSHTPGKDRTGVLNATATVTFFRAGSTPVQTVTAGTITPAGTGTIPQSSTPASTLPPTTQPATRTSVPAKTTYAPLPFWMVPAGLGIAYALAPRLRE